MDEKILDTAEQMLGYKFSDRSILEKSLLHASQASSRIESNERLEFLGDAVLDLVICQRLFEKFPEYLEGDLTKIKSMLVSRRTCAKVATAIGIDSCLNVGKGILRNQSIESSIVAGAIESVIAAIYIDGGLDAAKEFILRIFSELIEQADAQQHQENYKSVLQQYTQQHKKTIPLYEVLDEKGPDHDKCFEVCASVMGKRYLSAWGNNKKEAEQLAAYNALVDLRVIKP